MSQVNIKLRVNSHSSNLLNELKNIYCQESLSDVTLCCKGKQFMLHRIMLSNCSRFFAKLFNESTFIQQTPLTIILDDIMSVEDVEALVNFIYYGETSILSSQINSFISTANTLMISNVSYSVSLKDVLKEKETELMPEHCNEDTFEPGYFNRYIDENCIGHTNNENCDIINSNSTITGMASNYTITDIESNNAITDIADPLSKMYETHPAPTIYDIFRPDSLICDIAHPDSTLCNINPIYNSLNHVDTIDSIVGKDVETKYSSLETSSQEDISIDFKQLNDTSGITLDDPTNLVPTIEQQNIQPSLVSDNLFDRNKKCRLMPISKVHKFHCSYSFCKYKSNDYSNMKKHLKIHLKMKDYNCKFCSYKCTNSSSLNVHLRSHTGEKPFKCSENNCSYSSICSSGLYQHRRINH